MLRISIKVEGQMRRLISFVGMIAFVTGLILNSLTPVAAYSSSIELASLGNGNVDPNGASTSPDNPVTQDGRYVLFNSAATNLVPNFVPQSGTGTSPEQAFVHDRQTGTTIQASLTNSGDTPNQASYALRINSTGRYVLFGTGATNMGTGTSFLVKCYLRDLQANSTTLAATNMLNNEDNGCYGISSDGNVIGITGKLQNSGWPGFFCPHSPCNWSFNNADYIKNRTTGVIVPVAIDSNGQYGFVNSSGVWVNYHSSRSTMSDDGNIVSFWSLDPLVPGVEEGWHIYVRNMATGSVQLIPSPYGIQGTQNNQGIVSGNGRYVAYTTLAPGSQSTQFFVKDLQTGTNTRVDVDSDGNPLPGNTNEYGAISEDGTYVGFLHGPNFLSSGLGTGNHAYVRNLKTGATTLVDKNSSGEPGNNAPSTPKVINDGTAVFSSWATNLVITSAPRHQSYVSPPPAPAVPGNLSVSSPTQQPQLQWATVTGATTYNIYRNGTLVGSSESATYTDTTAPEGSDSYYVTAVNGGESAPSNTVTAVVDRTDPNVTPNPTASANVYGWYKDNVTVNWTVTDPSPSSGSPTQPVPTTADQEGMQTYTSGLSCDPVNNCATGSVALKIDKTSPTITYALSQTANGDGWHNSDVTVTFTCNDPLAVSGDTTSSSGIESCPPPVTVSSDGVTQTVTGTATDKAGNTASASVLIKLDKSLPSITPSPSIPANAAGWNNTDVTVSFSCLDPLANLLDPASASGIKTCQAPVVVTMDGITQTVTGMAADYAGNTATAGSVVKIDKTAPDISYETAPPANSAGWHNADVTVTFTCFDPLANILDPASASGIQSCSAPVTVSTEGGNQAVSGTATDNADNTTAVSANVSLDKTSPTLANVAIGPNPKAVSQTATLSASVSDALSGVNKAEYFIGNDPGQGNGGAMALSNGVATAAIGNDFPVGMYSFSVRVLDNAGNWSAAQQVFLDVYDPAGGYSAGHGFILPNGPTSDPGDSLPSVSGNNVKATLDFTAEYLHPADTVPSGDGNFSYGSGNCKKADNTCFVVAFQSFAWLMVTASNNTATFQGLATVTLNGQGVSTDNPVRITAFDGGPTNQADHFVLRVYQTGANPDTAAPVYQASGELTGGNVVVHL